MSGQSLKAARELLLGVSGRIPQPAGQHHAMNLDESDLEKDPAALAGEVASLAAGLGSHGGRSSA